MRTCTLPPSRRLASHARARQNGMTANAYPPDALGTNERTDDRPTTLDQCEPHPPAGRTSRPCQVAPRRMVGLSAHCGRKHRACKRAATRPVPLIATQDRPKAMRQMPCGLPPGSPKPFAVSLPQDHVRGQGADVDGSAAEHRRGRQAWAGSDVAIREPDPIGIRSASSRPHAAPVHTCFRRSPINTRTRLPRREEPCAGCTMSTSPQAPVSRQHRRRDFNRLSREMAQPPDPAAAQGGTIDRPRPTAR